MDLTEKSDAESLSALIDRVKALPMRRTRAGVTVRDGVRGDDPACTVLRGLMGERFRGLQCLTEAERCDGCGEASRCEFARVIGAPEAGVPGDEPRPFWLRGVPAGTLEAGERLEVELVTVGAHGDAALTSSFVDALERLGASALRRNAVRGVTEEPIAWPVGDAAGVWRIEARTPLVLTGDLARSRDNCPPLPFLALLASAGVRRVAGLLQRFDAINGEVSRVRLPEMRGVSVEAMALREWSGRRFSRRQERVMPLKGWEGSVDVSGVAPLLPLLRALTVTGVGKATSMGFGVLSVEPVP